MINAAICFMLVSGILDSIFFCAKGAEGAAEGPFAVEGALVRWSAPFARKR
jgi:hypothetical protein